MASEAILTGFKSFTCFILFLFLILERGEGRENERERNISVREKHLLVAFCIHAD